jgi:cytoplasmic iron level regulating protein YaaA (DUF328/UPF0246 family)
MLILLPPSEGKNQPSGAKHLNLNKLALAADLYDVRNRLLTKALAKAPKAKAMDVYSGVLYQALDWNSLSPAAKARGELTRVLLKAGKSPKSPAELFEIASKNFECKLQKPKGNLPWYLDLIIS